MKAGIIATLIVFGLFIWFSNGDFMNDHASFGLNVHDNYLVVRPKSYLLPLFLFLLFTFFFVSKLYVTTYNKQFGRLAIICFILFIISSVYSYIISKAQDDFYDNTQQSISK